MKKFEIGKSTDIEKFNIWFNDCSRDQIPYIIIRNKTKYSEIEWDHINLDSKFDKIFLNNSEEHRKQLLEVFKKYGNSKSKYTMTNLLFIAEKISTENAQKFAEELFDVILKRIQENE